MQFNVYYEKGSFKYELKIFIREFFVFFEDIDETSSRLDSLWLDCKLVPKDTVGMKFSSI